jgi:hypothetical protein
MQEPVAPLLGRAHELSALTGLLKAGHSCLVLGPPGSGKSRLAQEALPAAPSPVVFLAWPGVLHAFLVKLAVALQCHSERFPVLEEATSSVLKELIRRRLHHAGACIWIDDLVDSDDRTYRFLQEIYYLPQCSLLVLSVSRKALGKVAKLLWDPRETIELKGLSKKDAQALLDQAVAHYGLAARNLAEFQRQVLRSAEGNPGKILMCCSLAGTSRYRDGDWILPGPLLIDVYARFLP